MAPSLRRRRSAAVALLALKLSLGAGILVSGDLGRFAEFLHDEVVLMTLDHVCDFSISFVSREHENAAPVVSYRLVLFSRHLEQLAAVLRVALADEPN